jgi:integrase
MVLVVLGTALRRGELLALRWSDVEMLDRRVHVRRAWVRNQMTTPKSRFSRRTVHFGLKTKAALEEQWQASRYRHDDDLVFGHPQLGTPLDPSELTRSYVKKALAKAGVTKPLQPWHGSGTPRSRWTRPSETRTLTCRRRPATRSSRSPSGTSTRPK